MVISKIFKRKKEDEEETPDFIEIDTNLAKESKVLIKTFSMKSYEDVNSILNSLREGYTITVIDVKNLRNKDVIELKRAVSKIRKTVEAMEGSIAALGENVIIATPSFAKIQKGSVEEKKTQNQQQTGLDSF